MLRASRNFLCVSTLPLAVALSSISNLYADDADQSPDAAATDASAEEAQADSAEEAEEKPDSATGPRRRRGRRRGPGRRFPSPEELFKRMDQDEDGALTLEEFQGAMNKFRARMQDRRAGAGRGWGHGSRGGHWRMSRHGGEWGQRGRGRHGFHRRHPFGGEHKRGGKGGRAHHAAHRGGKSADRLKKLEDQIAELQKAIEKLSAPKSE